MSLGQIFLMRRSALALAFSLVAISSGCERADKAIRDAAGETGDGDGDGDGGDGDAVATGGTNFMAMGGSTSPYVDGCPFNDCGGTGGGSATGGSPAGAECGTLANGDDIYLVVEEYAIAGSCAAAVSYPFDSGDEGFQLNTTEGPDITGMTTASSFAHCTGGLDVTATILADGKAEIRRPIATGVNLDGCSLSATVKLISAEGCGFTVYPQLYPGMMGAGLQAGTPTTLTPNVSTELTLDLTGITTAGMDASYGVTLDRGANVCE